MAIPTLIYCAGGNKRFCEIAMNAGFAYGARLPSTLYGPLYFADQDWKRPDRDRYIACLAMHRPTLATVLDWERPEQLAEVLGWAEDAAPYIESVLIVPKVIGGIARLPRVIGGRPVRLAYAVGSNFGATSVPIWEFSGWPVHLLGGTPEKQMRLAPYFDVRSADGNFIQRLAKDWGTVWVPWSDRRGRQHHRVQLQEMGLGDWGHDAIYEAFRQSCANVVQEWRRR